MILLFVLCISCRKSRSHVKLNKKTRIEAKTNVSISSNPELVIPNKSGENKDDGEKIVSPEDTLIPKGKYDSNSTFLRRIAYTTSYNNSTRNPNWVAWQLTREHTDGPYSRRGVPYYSEDGTVYGIGEVTPETCKNGYFVDLEAEEPRQQLSDWTREYNMSHGHMCPAGDNKWDKAAMNQSFLLTNICPQDEKLNRGGWKKLEEKCRSWANRYREIYIVAGPIFNEPITRFLGEGRIAVPDSFFKVVLCLEGTPKAIGFIYINDSSSQPIKDNVFSVDDVEEVTGFDFFSVLSDSIENVVEAYSNIDDW